MTSLAQLTSGLDPLEVPAEPAPRGLYVHIPFCLHKCHYCDFYSLVDARDRQPAFADRLIREFRAALPRLRAPIETIFVGGGTPTLLAGDLWQRLLAALAAVPAARELEFSVEANPETVTPELMALLAGGHAGPAVNRLSLGAQSFDRRHLATLERRHDPASVGRAAAAARAAGIANLNLDLIFGIPGQTLADWTADLETALRLEPDHLSCYGLMYEPNTPLAAKLRSGAIERADEDVEAAMYEWTLDRLAGAGYVHYEISNWARPGRACRHNLLYWTNAPWWPLGPSAAGHVGGLRWKNAPRLDAYLDGDGMPPVTGVERLGAGGRAGEALMLGLRLVEGLPLSRVDELLSAPGGDRRAAAIARQTRAGLLEAAAGRLRLTRRGLLLADTVLADLL